jgi:hypothetical protein
VETDIKDDEDENIDNQILGEWWEL